MPKIKTRNAGYSIPLHLNGAGIQLLHELRDLFGTGIGDTDAVLSAMRVAYRVLSTMKTPGIELVMVDHRVPEGEKPKMTVLSVEPIQERRSAIGDRRTG